MHTLTHADGSTEQFASAEALLTATLADIEVAYLDDGVTDESWMD
jgi:hypothetical protein